MEEFERIQFEPTLRLQVEALAAEDMRPFDIRERLSRALTQKQIENICYRWRKRRGLGLLVSDHVRWTLEQIAALQTLWPAGCPASRIGREIGKSKNAVLGKIHRLGLAERSVVRALRKPSAPPSRKPGAATAMRAAANRVDLAPALVIVAEPIAEPITLPQSQRVSLMELRPGMCKWPLGDPVHQPDEFGFCGAPQLGASHHPYCGFHGTLAYQKRGSGMSAEHKAKIAAAAKKRYAARGLA